MIKQFYKVAGHVFSVQTEGDTDIISRMEPYKPFVTEPTESVVFSLRIVDEPLADEDFTVEVRQQDEGQEIVSGRQSSGRSQFDFWLRGNRAAVLVASRDYRQGDLYLENNRRFGINNALMVMYALATADKHTALFHSSVVSYQGGGYMFLGVSGTGKSTHSNLWMQHIETTIIPWFAYSTKEKCAYMVRHGAERLHATVM